MSEYLRPGSMPYAAAKLGVSLPTAYKLAREGRLRTYQIGRARRCTDDAIAQCIALLEAETRTRGTARDLANVAA
jgi:excisionase family DNA binding protein